MANWKQVVVALAYSLQFEQDLMDQVDLMADAIVKQRGGLGFTAEEALEVLPTVDQVGDDLSTLIEQPHSDAELRQFCRALNKRLLELTSSQRPG